MRHKKKRKLKKNLAAEAVAKTWMDCEKWMKSLFFQSDGNKYVKTGKQLFELQYSDDADESSVSIQFQLQ